MDPKPPITKIDEGITIFQNSFSLFPRYHYTHTFCLPVLATLRLKRYMLSHEKQDLDISILHFTEAIFISSSVVYLLFQLSLALLHRSDFDRPEDIKCSIEFLRYLRGLPLDSFESESDVPRNEVTALLTQALAAQVRSEAGDGTQNIEEMVVLCRELLTSERFADFPTAAFTSLSDGVNTEFDRGRSIRSLDEVVECLRDAVKACPPGSHLVLNALADVLSIRFLEMHSNDDYEEATVLLERILDINQFGECPDSFRVQASSRATVLAFIRSVIFNNPEYSQMAISRIRAELSSSSIDERLFFRLTEALAAHAGNRFSCYGLAESLEEARFYMSQAIDLSSSQSWEKYGPILTELDAVQETYSTTVIQQRIQRLEVQLSNTAFGTERYKECLWELENWHRIKFPRTNDISDIEESINYGRLLLDATHPGEMWRVHSLCSLRNILHLAFGHTNKTRYLDESIILGYEILKLKKAQHIYFGAIKQLVLSLLTRWRFLGRTEDPHEAIRLIPLVVDDKYASQPDRFRLTCIWAFLARHLSHPSALTAYKSAMSSIQRSLFFAPTVSIQHVRLVAMGEDCQRMPLDYASYQIVLGRFEEAVETLEQGRALLWSEMRGLRTPMAQLIEEDSPLANRFAEINQELQAMTISLPPSGRPDSEDGIARGRYWTDPFGRLVVRQRKLLEERDELVSQIQGRPGLEGFWKAPPFTTLRSAASRGPVILINHCRWRSDILIIFHNSLPCSIPTADNFYDRANQLRDQLAEAQKHGLDSGEYQDALCSVLKGLYKLVGEPVIKRFRVLGVPEQSRIWWCPTSVFCSLPLHAMGPIPSSNTSERYFSDLYIPSYTPSLSALIESRKASPQMFEKPSLLLVAQPEDSLPGVWGEIEVIQALNARVTNLVSNAATPTFVVEGLRDSRFAHFACHGELETGKPFEASFKLHGGSRLTLLDIVQSRLPDAEFALLSCCHTAAITEDSIADEALHLTAAMQYCGFRSVVGTMWAMADTDGRDLAKHFYKSLFSGRGVDLPYYERTARALRDATWKLRQKRGITLERWVNFVHYGA